MRVRLSEEINSVVSGLNVITIEADVENSETCDELWQLLENECDDINRRYKMEAIKMRPGIAATRRAYKALGKEPNRYRPSSEAMCRRIVKGLGLYRINTLVDIINIVSLRSGYSIGGFDAGKIAGDELVLGVGRHGDVFNAIGRGELNIEGLPVYRDELGGIGTPTSDEERTKLDLSTKKLLMCINVYGEELPVNETVEMSCGLLMRFANAKEIKIKKYE